MLLLLKLMLVPSLVAVATLAGRRWGPRVGGWFTALPIVGGPVLCFYAIEQGELFAARAAGSALAGLSAVAAFCIVYAWCARTRSWLWSGLAATVVFFLATGALHLATPGLALSVALAGGSIALARMAIRPSSASPTTAAVSTGGLPLRMAATATLVIVLTWLAAGLGPTLSGLLTVFPIATGIMASFTHAEHGRHALVSFFRGYLPALNAFALFCLVLALAFVPLGWFGALLVALAAQLTAHGALLWMMTR
jgi:hypothetical protein